MVCGTMDADKIPAVTRVNNVARNTIFTVFLLSSFRILGIPSFMAT
jgi:hypothetical protein